MKCKICGGKTSHLFETLVLNKYEVKYYKCKSCQFIQTEEPYWLEEAYSEAVLSLDIGQIDRSIKHSKMIASVLSNTSPSDKFLDYGCGYGLFVRLMRDAGFDFYGYDPMCKSMFDTGFRVQEMTEIYNISAVTAFEVFEHLPQPMETLDEVFSITDSLFFSTELYRKDIDIKKWWYLAPDYGQHIAFFSMETLNYIANKKNLYLSTNGKSIHLLTSNRSLSEFATKTFNSSNIENFKYKTKYKRESFLNSDYQSLLEKSI